MAPQLLAHTDWLTRLTRQTVRLSATDLFLSAAFDSFDLEAPRANVSKASEIFQFDHSRMLDSKWLHWLHWLHQIIWFILIIFDVINDSILVLLFDVWCCTSRIRQMFCLEFCRALRTPSSLQMLLAFIQWISREEAGWPAIKDDQIIRNPSKSPENHRKSPLCFCLTSSLISLPYYHLIYRSIGVSISVSVRKTLSGPQSLNAMIISYLRKFKSSAHFYPIDFVHLPWTSAKSCLR